MYCKMLSVKCRIIIPQTMKSNTRNTRRSLRWLFPVAAVCLLAAGCESEQQSEQQPEPIEVYDDENWPSLRGVVFDFEFCSRISVGYVISVLEPDSIGERFGRFPNVVKTYSFSSIPISLGDTVHGTYQFKPDSLTRDCTADVQGFGVPEILFNLKSIRYYRP